MQGVELMKDTTPKSVTLWRLERKHVVVETHTQAYIGSLDGSRSCDPGFRSARGNWNQKFSLLLFVLVENYSEERN